MQRFLKIPLHALSDQIWTRHLCLYFLKLILQLWCTKVTCAIKLQKTVEFSWNYTLNPRKTTIFSVLLIWWRVHGYRCKLGITMESPLKLRLQSPWTLMLMDLYSVTRAGDLKKSIKYDSGLSCRWALFTARAFGFKLHLIFNRV